MPGMDLIFCPPWKPPHDLSPYRVRLGRSCRIVLLDSLLQNRNLCLGEGTFLCCARDALFILVCDGRLGSRWSLEACLEAFLIELGDYRIPFELAFTLLSRSGLKRNKDGES